MTDAVTGRDEPAFEPTWTRKDDLPRFSPFPGISMQAMTGGRIMVNWVTMAPKQVVPQHRHPHEQAGVVLEGAIELTIGDETRLLRPSDAYTIPPDLPHSAVAGDDGCVVLDIFSPPREDYLALIANS